MFWVGDWTPSGDPLTDLSRDLSAIPVRCLGSNFCGNVGRIISTRVTINLKVTHTCNKHSYGTDQSPLF